MTIFQGALPHAMAIARTDNATLFAEGAVSTLRLIIYLAAAVALMVLDHRGGYLGLLRRTASALVEPAYRLAAFPADVARATRTAVTTQDRLAGENRELREQLLLAQARLNRLDTLVAQNARLKDLLDAHGVMGQVVEVLPNTAVAMLITDPTHAIPVVIERTGLRTIAYGSGAIDRLDLPNIPISADVRPGDRLLTSGLGGRFPAGFPVGEIRTVSNDRSGMFAAATARPAAALDRSGEVLLLRDQPEPYGPPALQQEIGPPADLAGPAPAATPAPAAAPAVRRP